MNVTFLNQIKKELCKFFGHRWRYKDYSNYIKPNGDDYDFKASRFCRRCNQYAYFYDRWQNQEKSKLDFESNSRTLKKLDIDNKIYS